MFYFAMFFTCAVQHFVRISMEMETSDNHRQSGLCVNVWIMITFELFSCLILLLKVIESTVNFKHWISQKQKVT